MANDGPICGLFLLSRQAARPNVMLMSRTALILDFLYTHTARLRAFHPDTIETRTLQLLVEARREAVDDKNTLSQPADRSTQDVLPANTRLVLYTRHRGG
jgi:hypothetical protein